MLLEIINSNLKENTKNYIDYDCEDTQRFLKAIVHSLIIGRDTVSIPFWVEQIGQQLVNRISFALSEEKLIVSKVNPHHKWGEIRILKAWFLDYVTIEELEDYRREQRIENYTLRPHTDEQVDANLTRTPNGIEDTGLVRKGFALASKLPFLFDTDYIADYQEYIVPDLIRGMTETAKKYPYAIEVSANYAEVSQLILQKYVDEDGTPYDMSGNLNDQRGRAIYLGLKYVFNPVSNKNARALLKVPDKYAVPLTSEDNIDDLYLFIAEELSLKAKSWKKKIKAGKKAYQNRVLPILTEKSCHTYMWLHRIYRDLDILFSTGHINWNIPYEVDATALTKIGVV